MFSTMIIGDICAMSWAYYVISLFLIGLASYKFLKRNKTATIVQDQPTLQKNDPVSVNFHFTRKCNYECGFCFHTAKTSYLTPLENAKIGLQKLKEAGMKKLNFSGGEPFLYTKYFGELCKYSKEVLGLESVSIVSNGSKIKEDFFKKYATYLDILAISVDSFDEATNTKIGRGKGNHLKQFGDISVWCDRYNVRLKINSVINRYNHLENFVQNISALNPARWKCFQVLKVDTENSGNDTKRDCHKFLITDEEFEDFCTRHKHMKCFVPESNRMMKSSYLILDEYMRFLNKGDVYSESPSILDVSVEEALKYTDWEPDIFLQRGGVYDWGKTTGGCNNPDPTLEWCGLHTH